jgi:hypothetical protein
MTAQDPQDVQAAARARAIREAQEARRRAAYLEYVRLQAGWVVDRYKALRAEGMDRLDALIIAGQVFQ